MARREHQSEQESTLKSSQILLVRAQTIPGTRRNALALNQFHGIKVRAPVARQLSFFSMATSIRPRAAPSRETAFARSAAPAVSISSDKAERSTSPNSVTASFKRERQSANLSSPPNSAVGQADPNQTDHRRPPRHPAAHRRRHSSTSPPFTLYPFVCHPTRTTVQCQFFVR